MLRGCVLFAVIDLWVYIAICLATLLPRDFTIDPLFLESTKKLKRSCFLVYFLCRAQKQETDLFCCHSWVLHNARFDSDELLTHLCYLCQWCLREIFPYITNWFLCFVLLYQDLECYVIDNNGFVLVSKQRGDVSSLTHTHTHTHTHMPILTQR